MSLRGLLPKLLNITVNSFVYLITNSHFCVENLFASFNFYRAFFVFLPPTNQMVYKSQQLSGKGEIKWEKCLKPLPHIDALLSAPNSDAKLIIIFHFAIVSFFSSHFRLFIFVDWQSRNCLHRDPLSTQFNEFHISKIWCWRGFHLRKSDLHVKSWLWIYPQFYVDQDYSLGIPLHLGKSETLPAFDRRTLGCWAYGRLCESPGGGNTYFPPAFTIHPPPYSLVSHILYLLLGFPCMGRKANPHLKPFSTMGD